MNNLYKNKKVLIFGLGLNQGGVGSTKFFAHQGAVVKVTDLKTAESLKPSLDELKQFPEIEYTLGQHKNEDIDWADIVIKNPAVKPGNEYIEYAIKKGKTIETDVGIFLQFVKPSQIIGITGTKGKSTTSSLIYEVLKDQGKKVVFAGNIGTSVLDTIPFITEDTLIVLEISSFQLEAFDQHKISPKWAVITNITPDHLNYYSHIDVYISAKKIIGKYHTEGDFLFLKKNDPITTSDYFLKDFQGQIIYFSKDYLPKDLHPKLLGEHNLENIAAALVVAQTFGLDEKSVLEVLSNFKGVPFRMELIKIWNGIKIYNDTAATSPEPAIHAIKTLRSHLKGGKLILVSGGMNKGMDYTKFTETIFKYVNKVFFLEGDSTDEILSSLNKRICTPGVQIQVFGPYNSLDKLLVDVKIQVKRKDAVLFSPAATSFNLFQNEFDRGRKFNEAVKKIFKPE